MAAASVLMIGFPSRVPKAIPLSSRRRRSSPRLACGHLAERPEARADFCGEQLRLLPGGEVAAPVGLVEVDDVGVELLDPAARGPEDLAREHGEAHRELHL